MDGPAQLAPVATIASVSASQSSLAYYTDTGLLDDGQLIGTLSVLPVSGGGGAAVPIGDGCFGAAFGKTGEVLHYSTNATQSTDGSAGGLGVFGAAHLWTKTLGAGVRLTNGLATWGAMPPDGSSLLLVDAQRPSRSVPGEVVLVRVADCEAGRCRRIVLDPSALVVALAVSADGGFAAYVKRLGAGAQAQYETWLVNVAGGTAVRVGHSGFFFGRAAVALSPGGSLMAAMTDTVKGAALLPGQLLVLSTATGLPVSWPALPAGAGVAELQFADEKTLFVHLAGTQAGAQVDQGLLKMTALGASRYSSDARTFTIAPAPDNRFLFASTIVSTKLGTANVILYDLLQKTPAPVVMATQSTWPPRVAISPDQSTIAFTDGYDPTTRTARLSLLALAGGSITTLTTSLPARNETSITSAGAGTSITPSSLQGITDSSTVADNFAAVPGAGSGAGGGLLYVDKPDSQGFGTLVGRVALPGGIERGVYNFQCTAPDSVFVSISQPDITEQPIRTAGIYRVLLPDPAASASASAGSNAGH